MTDEMVQLTQTFINQTYGNVIGMTVPEDGKTGWPTMFGLTRALQFELGMSGLADSFGPTTLSTLATKFPSLNASTVPSANFCRIIQGGLYCKGYDGGGFDGIYNPRVESSMLELKSNMGVAGVYPGSDLTPKVFKGLLNMDAYITVNDGSDTIRSIQQWLNSQYVNRQDFFIIPCDGHNSRDVAKSLIFAVQYALGMADGVATGAFGPATQAGLKEHPLSVGTTGVFVQLFTAAMILNQRPTTFTSAFTTALSTAVAEFQSFVRLPVTGDGDYSTWASLLVSHGDQDRKGAACDGVTRITDERAQTLMSQGIVYVGRYLTSVSGSLLLEKEIQPGELQTIANNGLRCFPIYQTFGRDAAGFSYAAGRADAQAAVNAAMDHGFQAGTRIYFAVDFDALDFEVTDNILPHFKGVQDAIADDGNRYLTGVYGARNVCARVVDAGHATASFVSDMSSGFSGNFGYPLPSGWAFDQIVTRDLGSGAGAITIDVDIASGRDIGQASFDAPRNTGPDTRLNAGVTFAMQTDIGRYMESIGFPLDGGFRIYTHAETFQKTVLDHDERITELSNRFNMRKALIQTSAYWETRHIGVEDVTSDTRTIESYLASGVFLESSTGIGQCQGVTGVRAWNYAINHGYTTGNLLDPGNSDDVFKLWSTLYEDEDYDLQTVCMVHLWDAGGKPGGDHDEVPLRPMSLDYHQDEIFEVLRRYQGFGEQAESDNVNRMGLYQIMEKYNALSRNM